MEVIERFQEGIELKGYRIGDGHPSIVITGGIHGDEQTGSYTAELVWKKLQNETLLGEVVIYPVCNMSAAKTRQRRAPEDNLDLNRIFPGTPDGSYSQRLANRIWQVTEGFDYLLDLHCCGLYGSTYSMHCYSYYDFAEELCRAIGVKTVIHSKGTRGQLYIEACEERNQKGLLIEMPGGQPGGVINEAAAEELADQIIGYLKYIGIVGGSAGLSKEVCFCGCFDKEIKAPFDGICRPSVTPGTYVKEGEVIACINDFEFKAPYDAVITGMPPMRFIFEGDSVARYAPLATIPKGAVTRKKRG